MKRATRIKASIAHLLVLGTMAIVFAMPVWAGGERLSITTALGARLFSIQYGDREPWPLAPDGFGFSLVPLDPVNVYGVRPPELVDG